MGSPLAAVEDFLSPAAKYELYNFHRPADRARMLQALRAPAPRIVALEGMDEENHLLLLEAACYQASRGGDPWECVRLSLEDYNPDTSTAESFLNDQLARRATRGGTTEKLRDALSGLAVGIKADLDISTALALSVAVTGGLRFVELLEAAAPTFQPIRGYPGPSRERLHTLVDVLTARSGLALYLPGSYPLPIHLRRWLIHVCRQSGRLLLAFADVAADGGEQATLGAPVRKHFTLAPLAREELRAAVDAHFGPNEFSPDFYDALLIQSKGVPWRLAEVMKRLMHAGALEGGGSRPWILADSEGSSAAVVQQFTSTFHEPVDRLRESDEPRDQALAGLVTLGALFSERFPAGLVCGHLGIDEEDVDGLIEEALTRFGPQSEHPLLVEANAAQDVPGERMLRFNNEIGRAALQDTYADEEREAAARALLATMDDAFPHVTPGAARLFYDLSQHLAAGERHWFREELEWWVGREAADDLQAALTEGLVQGSHSPETLLQVVHAYHQVWPAYRQNAVLESIVAADVEIPLHELMNYYHGRARVLLELGRVDEAERCAQTGLSVGRGNHPLAEGVFLSLLGWIARERSDCRLALQYAEAAMDAAVRWGHLDFFVPQMWSDLGRGYELLDRREVAEHAYLKALEIRETVCGPDDLDTAAICIQLAVFYGMSERVGIGLTYAERAMKIVRLHGPETSYHGSACVALGGLYARHGDTEAALAHSREAVRIMTRLYGPDHASTAGAYHSLGVVHTLLGDLAGAEEPFREALRIRRAVRPPTHEELPESLWEMGRVVEGSDPDAAERYHEQALGIYAVRIELGTRRAIRVLRYLVDLSARRGDLNRAIRRAQSGMAAIQAECESGGVFPLEKVVTLVADAREKLDPALHEAFTIHIAETNAPAHTSAARKASMEPEPGKEASSTSTFLSRLRKLLPRGQDGS